MKKNILALIVLSVFCSSCSTMLNDQKRFPSQAAQKDVDLNRCVEDFKAAAEKLVLLSAKNSNDFPAVLNQNLRVAISKTNIICVSSVVAPYGSKAQPKELQIYVENQLASLANLFESDLGKAGFQKYDVDPRLAFYDHMQVALAAHTYSEILGINDQNYDIFFKTLKLQEQ